MPKGDESETELQQDLESYCRLLKETDSADTVQLAVILATKMWTIEKKLDVVRHQLDELLRRTPPEELRRAPFN